MNIVHCTNAKLNAEATKALGALEAAKVTSATVIDRKIS
jgi:hypothetical protein